MSRAYYNEFNPFAAQWLRNLIDAKLIADGDVDDRSIKDVKPTDLVGYTQCHFFAGIGGWSLALRLAGVRDDRPVWTGSCPCNPFSVAGTRKGTEDDRHLWPYWYELIRQCKPAILFGEQVENAVKLGWLDLVQSQLEESGYATAAAVLPACSIGAPHLRKRLWFVGYTNGERLERHARDGDSSQGWSEQDKPSTTASGDVSMEDTAGTGRSASQSEGESGMLQPQGRSTDKLRDICRELWSDTRWYYCRDDKWRPVKRGTSVLVNGLSKGMAKGRVEILKGFGNAIVPQVGAVFIKAAMECLP